ncbi:CRISPR-associated endoribonuclease Cas6 [Calidifontibacillus erzurumensis]|uniref:CRISPR-associated endoribonuclease n=1 Tax=Calidifontibacillus erzurumensis TaxID=2741433 RepID=A0A8J8GIN0_9BACI|nr:CRISPR-associated endoribonuclease Cas6 [Calidifontibacillus erzurumensis]NSL53030.1 CRISPR-associated endoribonuclease Cas6 [Calidifontibacillus erzurumensis]
MRLQIKFTPLENNMLTLPLEKYQQVLQGAIYKNIADQDFSTFIHDVGFQYEKRRFKLFTFSQLKGLNKVNLKDKTITFYNQISWTISSVLPQFIRFLGQSFLQTEFFELFGQKMVVVEIRYIDSASIEASKCKIKMLSPITVYSTYVDRIGKKITQYYSPSDPAFSYLIIENLYKKYEAFYGQKTNDQISICPIGNKHKKIVTRFKGFIINAWSGEYLLEGDPKLISFAYDVGLGHKCSMGFGLFEIIKTNDLT